MRQQCPQCSFTRAWLLSDKRRKCRRCGKRYRMVSVWDASRLPDAVKRKLLDYFLLGVPSYRLRFHGLASRPARERFFRLVRAAMAWQEHCRQPFEGPVECDETAFGGHRKGKRGWGAAGKTIVFGLLQRNGQVRVSQLTAREKTEVMRLIDLHTKPGSLYYTDQWKAYASLGVRGGHVVVRKEKGRPQGREHINGIEGFWSYAKHWLYSYRGVPRKFFHLYLGEVSYRFNHRAESLNPLVFSLLKRLSLNEIQSVFSPV